MNRNYANTAIPTLILSLLNIFFQWIGYATSPAPEPNSNHKLFYEFVLGNEGMFVKEIVAFAAILLMILYLIYRNEKKQLIKQAFIAVISFLIINILTLVYFGLKYAS